MKIPTVNVLTAKKNDFYNILNSEAITKPRPK